MTRYYDRWGRRIPSPRQDHVPLDGYVLIFMAGVAFAATAIIAVLELTGV